MFRFYPSDVFINDERVHVKFAEAFIMHIRKIHICEIKGKIMFD